MLIEVIVFDMALFDSDSAAFYEFDCRLSPSIPLRALGWTAQRTIYRALNGPSPSVRSAAARQTMMRVCHLPRLSSGLPPSCAAFVLFRQPSSRFPAVGEKDAQPVTAEKENKNMNFKSNNNSNSNSTRAAQQKCGAPSSNRQQPPRSRSIAQNIKHLI